MKLFSLFAFWAGVILPASITDPAYPPDAFTGGTVVAQLQFSPGPVKVKLLSGEEPFASSVETALSKWRFQRDPEPASVVVIVNFRQPTLMSAGDSSVTVPGSPINPSLPYPKVVAEPPYPPNSLSEGSVVLELTVSAEGAVSRVEVTRGVGGLTQAGIDAVKRWRFLPAKDSAGRNVPSQAYAVLVFRRPLTILPPSGKK